MNENDSTQAGREFGERFVTGVFESLGVPGFNNILDSPNAKAMRNVLRYKPPKPEGDE